MKIKVLHVVLSLGTGGLENGIVNIINRCDKNRFKIDVICLREQGELGDRINNLDSEVFFDRERSKGLKNAIGMIREAQETNQYDIIHTHGWATMLAGYLTSLLERKPIVMNGEHGTLYFNTWRQRLIQRFLFNRMAINLSVSGALVEEISSRFDVKTSRFLPILNGVDIERFKPNLSARAEQRELLGVTDDQIVVGSVGRLVEVKNYPSLIKGFVLFLRGQPTAKLVLAGDGPMRAKLEELALDLDILASVIFLGRRDDIPAVMNSFDIFVLPSFREGLSNTILEAMSSGLPAVVSNVGGSPEIVIENETGHLFEVDDIKVLANKLNELAVDREKLKRVSDCARKHVANNYSLPIMVENYQKVYTDLVNERRGIS
jgi:sugar transferase (PEP-CTERM/EpsH1 system associated)